MANSGLSGMLSTVGHLSSLAKYGTRHPVPENAAIHRAPRTGHAEVCIYRHGLYIGMAHIYAWHIWVWPI